MQVTAAAIRSFRPLKAHMGSPIAHARKRHRLLLLCLYRQGDVRYNEVLCMGVPSAVIIYARPL